MTCDEDPFRRRPRKSTPGYERRERCVWMARKMTEWPSEQRPFKKNQDIVWLQRRWNSLGGGSVVQFPRIWMSYGKCRF